MKKALIVAAGNTESILLNEKYNLVIAADGGFDKAKKLGIKVDLFIGDFDSVKDKKIEVPKVELPKEKDFTDTEAAIEKAVSLGFKEIHLIGALGTRFDHSLANAYLLYKYHKKGVFIKIKDSNNEIFPVTGSFSLKGKIGSTVSLLPLSGKIGGLTLEGFYYPLKDTDIETGSTLTVSNVALTDDAKINIKEGVALVIISKD